MCCSLVFDILQQRRGVVHLLGGDILELQRFHDRNASFRLSVAFADQSADAEMVDIARIARRRWLI